MNDTEFEKRFLDADSQKSKTVEINGKRVLVRQSPLTRLEMPTIINVLCDIFLGEYQRYGEIINKEWMTRMTTIYVYTTATDVFNLDSKNEIEKTNEEVDDELDRFHELMYGTPLYAMLVGTQQDPRYFGVVPYTTPLIDVDQYNGILRAIDDTLEKRIFHWKAGLINENA